MGQYQQQHSLAASHSGSGHCRAAVRLTLALVLLLSSGRGSVAAAAPHGLRNRKQKLEDSLGRRLLQSCGQCPPASDTQAACNALSDSDRTNIRNKLISGCGSALMTAGACCNSLPHPGTPDWTNWVACMCYGGDGLAGLNAYVNPQDVLNACGCGSQQPTAAASPAASPAASSSSSSSGLSQGRSSFSSSSTSVSGTGSTASTQSYTGGAGGLNPEQIVNQVLGGGGGNVQTSPAATGPVG